MLNEIVCASVPNLPVHIGFGASGRKGAKCSIHFHDEIELLKVKKGKMTCTVGGKTYEISAGEVVFINSCVPHFTTVLEDNTASVLLQINTGAFSNDHISKYLSKFINSGDNQLVLFKSDSSNTKEVSKCIDIIKNEYEHKNDAYETYIKANIYHILAFLYRHKVLIDAENFFDYKIIDKVLPVLQYVDKNYQEPITLEKISLILNLNQQYFCRLFKKATNSTFMEYLNFVRICKAENLLSSTAKSIMEISLETGFSSVSYFNRTFKRFKNCSPTAYRKIKYAQN